MHLQRSRRSTDVPLVRAAFILNDLGDGNTDTFRRASKDTVLPLPQPVRGTDGTLMSELAIPSGTNIFLAIWACNRAEELWGPDAHEWKPERWLKPLPAAVESAAIPGVYSNLWVLFYLSR